MKIVNAGLRSLCENEKSRFNKVAVDFATNIAKQANINTEFDIKVFQVHNCSIFSDYVTCYIGGLLRRWGFILPELGMYGCILYLMELSEIPIQEIAKQQSNADILKWQQEITATLKKVISYVDKEFNKFEKKSLKPKPTLLIDIIQEKLTASPNSHIIIFVREKVVAKYLSKLINIYLPNVSNYITGHNDQSSPIALQNGSRTPSYSSIITTIDQQQTILNDFKANKFNVLVATEVAEEGIDIQSCNMVIAYDGVKSMNSLVQMQGRARENESAFIIFCENRGVQEKKVAAYDNSMRIIKILSSFKDGHFKPRNIEQLISNYALYFNRSLVETTTFYNFCPQYLEIAGTMAKCPLKYAKSLLLLCVYAIPSDIYMKYKLKIEAEHIDGKIYVKAKLPPHWPLKIRNLKDTCGYDTLEYATGHYCLLVLKELFIHKKINEYLLPKSKNSSHLFYNVLTNQYKSLSLKIDGWINAITPKSPQDYTLSCFNNVPNIPFNESVSHAAFIFPAQLDNFSKTVSAVDLTIANTLMKCINGESFLHGGNMLTHSIEHVCKEAADINKIALYTSIINKACTLNDEEYKKIQCFHFFVLHTFMKSEFIIFKKILKNKYLFAQLFTKEIEEAQTVIKVAQAKNKVSYHMCFTPVTKSGEIDWAKIESVISYIREQIHKLFTSLPCSQIAKLEDVVGKIIYTPYSFEKYIALGVSDDKMLSQFRWNNLSKRKHEKITYLEYYKFRYDIDLDMAKPLLKCISLNMLYDGTQHSNAFFDSEVFHNLHYDKEKEEYIKKSKQINELNTVHPQCINIPSQSIHVFPLNYEEIEQIKMLPSVLSKINIHNIANEFRLQFFNTIKISASSNLNVDTLEKKSLADIMKLDNALILKALTHQKANTGESYESLEFYGDSIMHFLVALDAFCQFPDADVGELDNYKTNKVNNKVLAALGRKFDLDKVILIGKLNFYGHFYFPGMSSSEYLKLKNIRNNQRINLKASKSIKAATPQNPVNLDSLFKRSAPHTISNNVEENLSSDEEVKEVCIEPEAKYVPTDKDVADIVESLTAVVYMKGDIQGPIALLRELGVLHNKEKFIIPKKDAVRSYAKFNIKELEDKLGYTFKEKDIIFEAITHGSSYYLDAEANSSKENCTYKRLEFVGDAFIDMATSKYLTTQYPSATPGVLHKMKICCLNNLILGIAAITKLSIDQFILYNTEELAHSINLFKEKLNIEILASTNEKRRMNLMSIEPQFEQMLGDLFESVIGAVIIDSMNVDVAYDITIKLLKNYFDEYGGPTTYYEHPKCEFFELMQSHKIITYRYYPHYKKDKKGLIFINEYIGKLNNELVCAVETDGRSRLDEKIFFHAYLKTTKEVVKEYDDRVKENIQDRSILSILKYLQYDDTKIHYNERKGYFKHIN